MDIANILRATEIAAKIGELKSAALRWEINVTHLPTHGYHVAKEDFEAFKTASMRFIDAELTRLHAEIATL
jgi:hypothetical protein